MRTLTILLLLLGMPVFAQNRVVNFSFEIADQSNAALAQGWQVYGNAYSRSKPPNQWDGSYALQVANGAGARQIVVLNQTSAVPVLISARVSGQNVVDDPADKLGASLDCKIAYHDGTFAWCPVTLRTKNVGNFDWKWVGYNTANLASSNVPIDWIEVRLRIGAVSGTAWFDDIHVGEWAPLQNGLVTFNFDDSLLSTYTKAYPALKSRGFVGTEAAITAYLDADANHMTLSQLKDLYINGWSIMSHTVHHPDLTTLNILDLNDELYWSHKYLLDNGFNVQHLALPYGAYNGLVMSRAQSEPYASVRTVDRDVNPQGTFPYNVHIQEVISSTTVNDVTAWLANARDRRSWLILLFHEIDNPNGIYTTTSSTFQAIVDAVSKSGLPVVTYDEGFNRMAAK